MGAVGSAYDDAMVESFWARMQVELFNRRTWKTRIELASAIHDHIELFHNTRRRHSSRADQGVRRTQGGSAGHVFLKEALANQARAPNIVSWLCPGKRWPVTHNGE